MPTICREWRTDICRMYDTKAWMNEWVNELSDWSYSQKKFEYDNLGESCKKRHAHYLQHWNIAILLFECLALAIVVYEFWNSNILSLMLKFVLLSTWWPGMNGIFHFSSHIELIWILWKEKSGKKLCGIKERYRIQIEKTEGKLGYGIDIFE